MKVFDLEVFKVRLKLDFLEYENNLSLALKERFSAIFIMMIKETAPSSLFIIMLLLTLSSFNLAFNSIA